MIKVEHVRPYNILQHSKNVDGVLNRLVTDAELVLVNSAEETPIFKNTWSLGNTHCSTEYFKPILISRTEKIEVGDWIYNSIGETIGVLNTCGEHERNTCFKILALPEHFPKEHLQMIVDGKLKEGKVVVECDSFRDVGFIKGDKGIVNHIKLNSSGHVTIYPVSEKCERKFCLMDDFGNCDCKEDKVEESIDEALGNLLAVLHRDGGHYQSKVGTLQAIQDAESLLHTEWVLKELNPVEETDSKNARIKELEETLKRRSAKIAKQDKEMVELMKQQDQMYTREEINQIVIKYLTDYSDLEWKEWFKQNVR